MTFENATPESTKSVQNPIEKLLARLSLLGGIYLAVNLIYQSYYYTFYGLGRGVFTLSGETFLFSNYLIAVYAVFIWGAFLVFLPENAYIHLEKLFDISYWLNNDISALFRWFGLLLSGIVIIILDWALRYFIESIKNYVKVEELYYTVIQGIVFLLVVSLLFLRPYNRYRRIRSKGLSQITLSNMVSVRQYLNIYLVLNTVTIIYALIFFVPSRAGTLIATLDWNRLLAGTTQEVHSLGLNHPACQLLFFQEGKDTFFWIARNNEKIHYVGKFQGNYELFAIANNSILPQTCLIPEDEVQSIYFGT